MSKFQLYTIFLLVCMVVIVELANVPNAKLKAPGSPLKAPLNANKRMKREAGNKLKSMDGNNKLKGGGYGYYDSYDSYYPYYDSYYYDSYGSYDSYYYDSYYKK